MPAFGLDNIHEWPYLAELAYYKMVHRTRLVFVIDGFYKNTPEFLRHGYSDIVFMITSRELAGADTYPPM